MYYFTSTPSSSIIPNKNLQCEKYGIDFRTNVIYTYTCTKKANVTILAEQIHFYLSNNMTSNVEFNRLVETKECQFAIPVLMSYFVTLDNSLKTEYFLILHYIAFLDKIC